jgi:type III secretion protein L
MRANHQTFSPEGAGMVVSYRLREIGVRLASGAHIIPAADFAAIEEARSVVAAAEDRGREIVEGAKKICEEEKLRGYRDGQQQARLEAVERLLAEARTLDSGLQAVERDLAHLVEACVRKIIYGFDDAARAEAAVRQALAKMRRERRVELRTPPALYAFFRATIDAIRREYPEIELIDVVQDESLDAEQIVVESSIGRVDANLGQKLRELRLLLLQKVDAPATRAEETDKRVEPEKKNPQDSLRSLDELRSQRRSDNDEANEAKEEVEEDKSEKEADQEITGGEEELGAQGDVEDDEKENQEESGEEYSEEEEEEDGEESGEESDDDDE